MTRHLPARGRSLHSLALLLAACLAAIHLYLGVAVEPVGSAASVRFLVIGSVFLAGAIVSLTAHFRPVLYLLGALFSGTLGVLWLLGGREYVGLGLVTGALGGSFLLLTVYLFVVETWAETA